MRPLFLLSFMFLAVFAVSGNNPDTLKPEKMDERSLHGTYWSPGSTKGFLVLKRNHRFKVVFPAPRSMVYKGKWEVRNDTLCAFLYHKNFTLYGESRKVKDHPLMFRCICANSGKFYRIDEEDGRFYVLRYLKSKPDLEP